MPVQDDVMDLIFGRWRSQNLHAGTKLNVFECVGAEAKPAAQIATELSLDGELAYRLMRAIGALGLLHEDASRNFSISEAGTYVGLHTPHG